MERDAVVADEVEFYLLVSVEADAAAAVADVVADSPDDVDQDERDEPQYAVVEFGDLHAQCVLKHGDSEKNVLVADACVYSCCYCCVGCWIGLVVDDCDENYDYYCCCCCYDVWFCVLVLNCVLVVLHAWEWLRTSRHHSWHC